MASRKAQGLWEETMTSSQQTDFFEHTNDSVMTRTMEGIINFWNHSAEQLYGWRKEEAIGKVSHKLLKTQFPKPLKEIESELVRNGRWEGKLVHTTRDGSRVVVESRWSLELTGQVGALVEINTPATDHAVEIGRQEAQPAKKSTKIDGLPAKIANIVLAAGGIFCLLLLLGVFYYYGWSGQKSFTSPAGQFIYFAFPGLMAIALFACLRLPASQRINVALCCASVALTIYTVEATMALWFSLPSVRVSQNRQRLMEAAKALGVKYDSRTNAEVIDDFRKRGIDAVPSLYPEELLKEQKDGTMKSAIAISGVEVLPLASISEKLTVVCNDSGEFLTYTSDRHGFHNPPSVWSAPIEIVAVGDSFTKGWCVGPDDNFVSLIRQHHPGTLNLGMEGNGPLVMLATLKEYAEIVKPKVVLWFYFEGNDLGDLRRERQNSILMHYLANKEFSQGLVNRQAEIDHALAAYLQNVPKTSWSIKLKEISERIKKTETLPQLFTNIVKLNKLRERLGLVYGAKPTSPLHERAVPRSDEVPQIKLLFDVLSQAKKSVGEWGGSLYFIYLPARYRYDPSDSGPVRARYAVLQTANKAGLPVIDMHPIFMAQKDPLSLFSLRLADHYNEEGNRLVAQEVLWSISDQAKR
jgi:PAS domain S-box-containing protein